jgi:hypothetical protein
MIRTHFINTEYENVWPVGHENISFIFQQMINSIGPCADIVPHLRQIAKHPTSPDARECGFAGLPLWLVPSSAVPRWYLCDNRRRQTMKVIDEGYELPAPSPLSLQFALRLTIIISSTLPRLDLDHFYATGISNYNSFPGGLSAG